MKDCDFESWIIIATISIACCLFICTDKIIEAIEKTNKPDAVEATAVEGGDK